MNAGELLQVLSGFFHAYGYLVIFVGTFLENTLFVGLVVPGEVIILLGAFFASQGRFGIVPVGLLAFVGSLLASNVAYFLGRKGGRPFIERFGAKLFISKRRIEAAERYFDEHGAKTVFISRFTAGIKNFVPALAGASRMNYGVFLGYSTLGLTIWITALCALGYFFGSNWPLLARLVKALGWGALAIVAGVAAIVAYRRYSRSRGSRGDDRDAGDRKAGDSTPLVRSENGDRT